LWDDAFPRVQLTDLSIAVEAFAFLTSRPLIGYGDKDFSN
jgi:hypothetical protein